LRRDGSRDALETLRREQNDLKRRVAEFETREGADDASAPEHSPAATPAPIDVEAENKAIRTRHEEMRTRHANEARDGAWARDEETSFTSALAPLATRGGYKLVGVDCRTTLCTADLEWSSYGDASKYYRDALHVDVPGCESAILLEPPADGSAPYRATARYDCEGSRTGDAQ
jgi:hypothetical protein